MFEQTAPKNSEGKNKKPVREAAELRMPSILYPWSPLGIHAWGRGGLAAGGLGAACTLGQIQTSSASNFEVLKKRSAWVQGCRWRSSLQLIVASRVFTEKHRCNLHNLSRKYRLFQLKFGHIRCQLASPCCFSTTTHHCCQEVNRRLSPRASQQRFFLVWFEFLPPHHKSSLKLELTARFQRRLRKRTQMCKIETVWHK